tara:strand:- start:27 stop:272 length:246 start_codon:yes stop_codon:yes gene_type:complete
MTSENNWLPKKGDRIKFVSSQDKYTQLKEGDMGLIVSVELNEGEYGTYYLNEIKVNWDSGSSLSLLPGEGDQFMYYSAEEV